MDNTCLNTRIKVFDRLLGTLRASIHNGNRSAGEFIGTEQALSRETGISRVSVRRATEQLIREGLIERRAGKGLFVRPADRATRLVQVIVPDLAFESCVQIARGAQIHGADCGVEVQVHDAHNRMDRDIKLLRQIDAESVDGAIVLSWHCPDFTEALIELKQRSIPFVLVDQHLRDMKVDSVSADNHAGGMAVGKALLQAGHRKIGFVGNLSADTVRARLEGLRDAIGDLGQPFDRSYVMDLAIENPGDWQSRISQCTRELIERSDRPTAVFFSDDQVAAEAYLTMQSMGLRLPQDMSVVGFDDSPLCRWLKPQLASVRQPYQQMGCEAMKMLMEKLSLSSSGSVRKDQQLTLSVEYKHRESIAAPPKQS